MSRAEKDKCRPIPFTHGPRLPEAEGSRDEQGHLFAHEGAQRDTPPDVRQPRDEGERCLVGSPSAVPTVNGDGVTGLATVTPSERMNVGSPRRAPGREMILFVERYFRESTVASAVAELHKRGLGSAETHSASSRPDGAARVGKVTGRGQHPQIMASTCHHGGLFSRLGHF